MSEDKSSVKFVLDKLSSVLSIGVMDRRLRIGHLSFSEFLHDPNQCPKAFLINRTEGGHKLTMACLHQMKEGLKFNICDLETSYLLNSKVENLSERTKEKISGPLSYSSLYWAAHLQDIASAQESCDPEILEETKDFFYRRFLFWLEVMSLLEQIPAANAALQITISSIEVRCSLILFAYVLKTNLLEI